MAGLDPTLWQAWRVTQESERIVVLMKPSNVGGGKGPHFWHACEGAEARVIGDEPSNTIERWTLPNTLYGNTKPSSRGCAVKLVGEPDAGNPHVRFDERRRETERCRMAQVTAPFFDSTPTPPSGGAAA